MSITNKKSDRHLIVFSLDALNAQDFDYIKELPNFKAFIEEGSYVREVLSVYPSVTYTCHTSIITGTYPDKHGIYANEKYQPQAGKNQEWFWYEKDIKVPTLFDYANKASLSSASVLWPVMAGAPITYNCPEIWPIGSESYFSLYWKYSTKNTLPIILKNASKFKGKEQPYLDNFVEAAAIDMIIKKKPNLLCMHLIELDHERHVAGLNDKRSEIILKRLDERIKRIIQATKKAGIYDNTTFVLLGDHGCTDFSHVIFLNTLFLQEGLLKTGTKGNITSWKVYSNSCSGSTQIHINSNCDEKTRKKIDDIIGKLAVMPNTYIKNIYTKYEARNKLHLSGDFEYVLEPKKNYIFANGISDEIVKNRASITGCYKADHGHNPNDSDMKTLFFAKGKNIKKGASIQKACIVDEGPTLAKILGIEMDNVDGRVLSEILL